MTLILIPTKIVPKQMNKLYVLWYCRDNRLRVLENANRTRSYFLMKITCALLILDIRICGIFFRSTLFFDSHPNYATIVSKSLTMALHKHCLIFRSECLASYTKVNSY